jgi:hypothetical protein
MAISSLVMAHTWLGSFDFVVSATLDRAHRLERSADLRTEQLMAVLVFGVPGLRAQARTMADTLRTNRPIYLLGESRRLTGGTTMPTDHVAQPWAFRSTLIAVTDLDRSIAFYRDLGPFDEVAREDAVAMLGELSSRSFVLILREMRGHPTRHGQQSLGLRSISFNVGSLAELDRIESVLRDRGLFTSRRQIADGVSELLLGRDPDNLPLGFVWYTDDKILGPDYYRTVANLVYSQDA